MRNNSYNNKIYSPFAIKYKMVITEQIVIKSRIIKVI